ncbi:hypothetical protein [Halegenticoccus tardaugens]|uniref:hypothetical protein n=1 Tax=Halegenticoccus tardaugens TaxID=2071624 RepID=UPI00100B33D3|nr:hypothetical protein [Halegenticoccus tardaugens]
MNLAGIFLALVFSISVGFTSWRRVGEDLFHPIVLVNVIMLYYIIGPAWFLLFTNKYHFGESLNDPSGSLTLTLGIAFLTYCVIVGVYSRTSPRTQSYSRSNRFFPDTDDIDRRVLFGLGVIGFLTGIFTYLYYVFVNGGFIRLLTITPRTAFAAPDTARFSFLAYAGIMAGMVTIFLAYRPEIRRDNLTKFDYYVLAAILSITFAIVLSLRSRMNLVIPAAYILLYAEDTDQLPRSYLIGGAAALFTVGMSYTMFEAIFADRGAHLMMLVSQGLIDTIRLEVLMHVIDAVPSSHPYQWGATFVHTLGIRWEGMPASYGNQLQEIVIGQQRDYITFPALMLGELYLNFGALGLFLGGGIFGYVLKVVHHMRTQARTWLSRGISPLILLGIVSMLPTSIAWGVKSIWLRVVVPVTLAIFVAYVITHVVLRGRRRQIESISDFL